MKVWVWIRRERLLALLLIAFPLLWLLTATPMANLPGLVHWHTIAALTGLMILSSAIQWSGMVNYVARHLLRSIHSERLLATALCLLAAILAAVITNDVALFLVIPLTLALARITRLPIVRLVIFQALAVNAGSALSPIGNPQNIFLWQTSEVSFVTFTLAMLPMALPFILVIGAGILLAFHSRPLLLEALPERAERVNRQLFWPTLALYPLFLYALDQGQGWIASVMLIVIYACWQKRRLLEIDWALLLLFVLMFANLGMLTQLSQMHLLAGWLLDFPGSDLTAGILLSQIISNVPAAIFLEPFSADWQQLAWGVNIGGFGLAIGSLANLIALRLARQPGLFTQFHLWSIPCLLLTFLLVMFV
jgi:Na+/H+ antiporter NhaD/arsenite permease-like protein